MNAIETLKNLVRKPVELRPLARSLRAWDEGQRAIISSATGQLTYLPQKLEQARSYLEEMGPGASRHHDQAREAVHALEQKQAALQRQLKDARDLREKHAGVVDRLIDRIERLHKHNESMLGDWPARRGQMLDEQAAAAKAVIKLGKEHAANESELTSIKAGNAAKIERLTTACTAIDALLTAGKQDRASLYAEHDAAYTRAVADGLVDLPAGAESDPRVAAVEADIRQQTARHAALLRGLDDATRAADQAERTAAENLATKRRQLDDARQLQHRLRWDVAAGDLVMLAAEMHADQVFRSHKFSLPIFDHERVPGGRLVMEGDELDNDAVRGLAESLGCTDTVNAILADLKATGIDIEY